MAFRFRFLEDLALADIAFEAQGDPVEELFPGCTQALLEVVETVEGAGMTKKVVELRPIGNIKG